MRIHFLQHVNFENPGLILQWAKKNKYKISFTKFYKSYNLPHHSDYDMLVVMGGPMGVYDESKYSWLLDEKKFIEKAITTGKKVLGICLGAQLIACVLGARVYKNNYREIGWFDIEKTSNEFKGISDLFPQKMKVFHWHGDTYDIPKGALHLLRSEACVNQAFMYEDKVLALQFHLELKQKNINALIKHCKDEIIKDIYIQNEKDIKRDTKLYIDGSNDVMIKLLSFFKK